MKLDRKEILSALETITIAGEGKNMVESGAVKNVLIFGNEVMGVDQQAINQSDICIEIPQFGTKHSFNIAVTAGIVLWECYRQLHK